MRPLFAGPEFPMDTRTVSVRTEITHWARSGQLGRDGHRRLFVGATAAEAAAKAARDVGLNAGAS